MIYPFLENDEKIILDFTPNAEQLKKAYKTIKMSKLIVIIGIAFFVVLIAISFNKNTLDSVLFLLIPFLIIFFITSKNDFKKAERSIYEKYLITNKRLVIFNTNDNTTKYIYFYNITNTDFENQLTIFFYGNDENGKKICLKYKNVMNMKQVLSVVEEQKRHINY